MSTIAPPEAYTHIFPRAVSWSVYFEDGTHVSSGPQTWWFDVATIQDIDGIPLALTTKPVKELYLYPDDYGPIDERIILELPAPAPAFAFTRYSQPLVGADPSPVLLYTAFGYVLADYCYLLTIHHVTHDANRIHTLHPRPLTSPLW